MQTEKGRATHIPHAYTWQRQPPCLPVSSRDATYRSELSYRVRLDSAQGVFVTGMSIIERQLAEC